MKSLKHVLVLLFLLSAAAWAQVIFQGPASGSVPSGVVVTTGSFEKAQPHTATFRSKPLRNLFTNARLPNSPDMPAPSAAEGSNYQIDPTVGNPPTEDFVLTNSFQALPDQGYYIPPDPYIAVGPTHLMAVVNSRFSIMTKTGTAVNTIEGSSWYASTLTGADVFDPKIIYDQFSKRWVMVWLYLNSTSTVGYFMISVSDDSIPTGTWYNWKLPSTTNGNTAAGNWADYEGVGYDENCIYITSNQFTPAGSFNYGKIRIIPKSELYANTAGALSWKDLWDIRHPDSPYYTVFGVRPVRHMASSSTAYFVGRSPYVTGTYFTVWKLTNPLTSPSLTAVNVPVTAYSDPPDPAQLGSSQTIDGGASNLRNEPVFFNNKLYSVHAVRSGTGNSYSSVRYFVIDVNTNTAVEDKAMGVDKFFYTYPALAVDGSGNLALTYSRSATTEYCGAFYTTRPLGATALTGSRLLKAGNGTYFKDFGGGRNRWGDYNGLWTDPSNLSRVYAMTEYVSSTNMWGSWIGELTFSATAASISVTSPRGGETWTPGTQQNITWMASNVANVNIEYSTNNGIAWQTVASGVAAASGTFAWTIPNTPSTACKVRVADASNTAVNHTTEGQFAIGAAPTVDWQLITSGTTGDIWGIDFADANNVWISTSTGDVKRSTDGGLTFVAAGNAGDGAYSIAALSATRAVVALGPSSGNGAIKLTTDGGTTWTQVYTATGAWFNFIDNFDANNLWALSDPISGVFHIVKSSNGGSTWTLASNLPAAPATTVYGANNSWYQIGNTLWFGTGGASGSTLANRVYKSSTGPDGPWTYATTTNQFSGSMAFSSTTGYGLVGFWQANNSLNRTTNGGTAFTALTTTNTGLTHGIEYIQGTSNAYAACSTGVAKTTNNGTTWTIENMPTGATGEPYFIRLGPDGTTLLCGGAGGFLIRKGGTASGSITVTAPNGGESWQAGTQKNITWTSSNVTNVKIDYTTNNGTNWSDVASSVAAAGGTYTWTVPNTPTTQAKVRISDASAPSVTDMSNAVFTITQAAPVFTWQTVINVKDAGTDNQNLTFGTSPQATNGMDPALGELPLPPAPPAGIFDARFELPVTPADYSLKDYRNDSLQAIEWVIKYQASVAGYPMTLAWNPANLPAGNFMLKDMITGTIISIDMKTQNNVVISNSGITALKIVMSRQICKDVTLAAGWNILSVPVNAASMATGTLFPAATSPAYGYSGNYVMSSSLSVGKGYFLRYGSAAVINICGTPPTVRTIPLLAGWNIVGAYEADVLVASLGTTPAGIITSPFYGYSAGYQQATSLVVGKGYWVRANQAGVINLPTALGKAGEGIAEITFDKNWGKVIVTDASGQSVTLYVAQKLSNASAYELPPVPPNGVFDVRFTSQKVVEVLGASGQDLVINGAQYPVTVRAEGIDLMISDKATGGKIVNGTLKSGGSINIGNSGINVLNIGTTQKPVDYALYQNYPNPFNPTTLIKFSIAEKSSVKLNIFNQLGQKVAELINGEREAGIHDVEWNAGNLPSGIYYYELQAGNFTAVKKLMLMK